jgi:hypothetical protein
VEGEVWVAPSTALWATGRPGDRAIRVRDSGRQPASRHVEGWGWDIPRLERPSGQATSSVRGGASCRSEAGRRGQRWRCAFHRHPGRYSGANRDFFPVSIRLSIRARLPLAGLSRCHSRIRVHLGRCLVCVAEQGPFQFGRKTVTGGNRPLFEICDRGVSSCRTWEPSDYPTCRREIRQRGRRWTLDSIASSGHEARPLGGIHWRRPKSPLIFRQALWM